MSQPESHPFHVTNLISPALDGIIRALSNRPGVTAAQSISLGRQYVSLILSLLPRDTTEMVIAGQAIVFNEVLAEAAFDILGGMVDTMKPRAQSAIISMGRLTQGHLDLLAKRGANSYRAEAGESQNRPKETRSAPAAEPTNAPATTGAPVAVLPAVVPPTPVPPVVVPSTVAGPPSAETSASPRTVASPGARQSPTARPASPTPANEPNPQRDTPAPLAEATNWLDDPHEQQWVIETALDIAARAGLPLSDPPAAPARLNAPTPAKAPSVPALPHHPAGFQRSRELADARAD